MKEYHFKMQLTNAAGEGTGSVKDLETDFPGLHYCKCEGLEDVGKAKNIYLESYPEASGARAYHPSDNTESVTYETTEVKLTLIFLNDTRRVAYNQFRAFIDSGRLFYWDNARNKKVWLVREKDPVKPDNDTIVPSGYIGVTFVFTNLWGIGKKCKDDGTLL